MYSWTFRKKMPGEKSRNPMQDEFFASNSETGALVRESIQNSLDACLDKAEPVRVRFFLSGNLTHLGPDKTKEWFGNDAWEHFQVDGNGLKNNPLEDSSCQFLVYEDFNTSGLNGDIFQDAESSGTKNAFYYFLRAEGQSDKVEGELGSWGVGKIVFPRSSNLRTIFVLTTRSEDSKSYLSGQSILKYHSVGGQEYSPDGWFGKMGEDGLGLPIDDENTITKFSEVFNISRKNKFGLSLVIPWLDTSITFGELARSVIEEYFFPILMGRLDVLIETDNECVRLDCNTLLDEVEKYDESPDRALVQLVELAGSVFTQPSDQIVHVPKYAGSKPEWQSEMISDEVAACIWGRLAKNGIATVRIPVAILHKNNTDVETTYFDVVLKEHKASVSKPVFVRDGLVIRNVIRPRSPGFIALVVIMDKPLKKLLGQAENPAHTEWNKGSDHFKGKYSYGGDYLNFVRLSVKNIIQYIQKDDDEVDSSILSDLFSIPIQDDGAKPEPAPTPSPGPNVVPPIIPPIIPPKRYYQLVQLDNGFRVSGKMEFSGERKYVVNIAYDTLRGDPFSKWHKADFIVTNLSINSNDIQNIEAENNNIKFTAGSNIFSIEVKGFDVNRDLKVRVKSEAIEYA